MVYCLMCVSVFSNTARMMYSLAFCGDLSLLCDYSQWSHVMWFYLCLIVFGWSYFPHVVGLSLVFSIFLSWNSHQISLFLSLWMFSHLNYCWNDLFHDLLLDLTIPPFGHSDFVSWWLIGCCDSIMFISIIIFLREKISQDQGARTEAQQ